METIDLYQPDIESFFCQLVYVSATLSVDAPAGTYSDSAQQKNGYI